MDAQEYMTIRQAREALGVSRTKMADLLKDGVLLTVDDTLDKRKKLVRRADVERLKRGPHAPSNQLAIAV
jgi:hypothetical protein